MYQLAQWMLWWMQAQDINIFYVVSLKLFLLNKENISL